MAYLFTTSRRTRQPLWPVRVDWSHWAAPYGPNEGLWLPGVSQRNLARFKEPASYGTVSPGASQFGLTGAWDGSTKTDTGIPSTMSSAGVTLAGWFYFNNAASTGYQVGPIYGGAAGITWGHGNGLYRNVFFIKGGGGYPPLSFGSLTEGSWYFLAGTASPSGMRSFVNGSVINSVGPGYGWGTLDDGGSYALFGSYSSADALIGSSPFILKLDRALTDEQIRLLYQNHWQLFAPEPRRLWWYGTSAGGSTVDATATGATVVASSSAIAGALTAASSATAATVAASASVIAGAATSSSQAAAATVTATASAMSGAATGAGQSAAATVATTASATGGEATAASATTAATITASSSAIAGAASGTAAATATGATVVADASIIAGSATGNAAGTATGATVAADASAIAGSSSASAAATGQTAAVTASATAGSAQSDHAAAGAVVSASTTAIPGAIAVGAGATTLGATVAATVTYQSGAVAAASSAAGWTQVVTAIAARGVAYGALPDIDPRYLVPSRKRRFTVQARGRRFNART